jgi:hypothetical protein
VFPEVRDDWVAHGASARTVVEARGTAAGDRAIVFADDCVLETFVNQANLGGNGDNEFWRLLPPPRTEEERDVVVTARGVES